MGTTYTKRQLGKEARHACRMYKERLSSWALHIPGGTE